MCLVDMQTQKVCYKENEFISSETIQLFYESDSDQLFCLNQDQNLFTYELAVKSKKLSLIKTASKCLYLDEVIDIKFLKQLNVESTYAIMCSNSETLKLYNTQTNDVELYSGHTDIILCIDTYA